MRNHSYDLLLTTNAGEIDSTEYVLDKIFVDFTKTFDTVNKEAGSNLFNVNQFKSASRTRNVLVRELIFADDTAFVAHIPQNAQEIINRISKSVRTFGLKINQKETQVMYQLPPGSHDTGQGIQVGQVLTQVNKFEVLLTMG